jgi:starch synthase
MPLFAKKPILKVLFVASEAAPFARAGGLGAVMYSLPKALNKLGYDSRLMIPLYLTIDQEKFPMKMVERELLVPSGSEEPFICNVKIFEPPEDEKAPVVTYFLENMEYYEKRANIYGYSDDPVRWALLSRGVLEFILAHKDWRPDVIVSCDWQAGLIPDYLHAEYKDNPILKKIAVLFAIHNLYYQGMFDHHFVSEMDYDAGQAQIPAFSDPRLLKLNFMRRGIMHSDAIVTVSPTYAKEITTPEYGEFLDVLLRERRSRLYGVLNGIDYNDWNPETDSNIESNFNAKTIEKRVPNKKVLQTRFNLPVSENTFVLGVVSRFTEQKGFDLLIDSADAILRNFDVQLIVLGTGDSRYMGFFQDLRDRYPQKVAVHLSFDAILPRLIYAGADAVLIPSRYEPSGLTQMEAMRYGAIPIVRFTGGLADSVIDYNPAKQTGNGFVFEKFDHYALLGTIIRALEAYKYKEFWKKLQERAMAADFSWEMSGRKYGKLFKKAIELHLNSIKESE